MTALFSFDLIRFTDSPSKALISVNFSKDKVIVPLWATI
jgi:hypothetical protein